MWRITNNVSIEEIPEIKGDFLDKICQKGAIYITTTYGVYCLKPEFMRAGPNEPDELIHTLTLVAGFANE